MFHAPHGPIPVILAVVCVIGIGPWLAEKARIPGIIGLLVGGVIIGPHVTHIVTESNDLVPALGNLGLLYLMFLAGVELNLQVFRQYRRAAIIFGLITFSWPMLLGTVASLGLGYTVAAAVLVGSLCASHTLVTYPIARRLGLSSNRAVATTVAATVITDTLALAVLAVVAGTSTGSSSGLQLTGQLVLGMASLFVWSFLIVPRIGRWFFSGIGQDRTLRFVFALVALSSAAVLAEVFGIEGIVGAFFAGLGMNRLVPNRGPLMEKIEFFGSAFFIPVFLISVGLIINPGVMIEAGTLGLAAVLIATCLGGKMIAAWSTRRLFKFSGAEARMVFALSSPQAAATLAATIVGFDIGLFGEVVVNAVLVLIVVSLVVASVLAKTSGKHIPPPAATDDQLGRTVLLALGDETDIGTAARVAARLAESEGGIVVPIRIQLPPDGRRDRTADADGYGAFDLERAERELAATGLDAEILVRRDTSVEAGISHATAGAKASILVLTTPAGRNGRARASRLREIVADSHIAVMTVHAPPLLDVPINRIALLLAAADISAATTEVELCARVAGMLRSTGLPIEIWTPPGTSVDERLRTAIAGAEAQVWNGNRQIWLSTPRRGVAVLMPGSRVNPAGLVAFAIAGVPVISVAEPGSSPPATITAEAALSVVSGTD
jgi:Kef-type K+ transport system membrane component KefB